MGCTAFEIRRLLQTGVQSRGGFVRNLDEGSTGKAVVVHQKTKRRDTHVLVRGIAVNRLRHGCRAAAGSG